MRHLVRMERLARCVGLGLLIADARLLGGAETSGVPERTGEIFARAKVELNHTVQDGRIAGGVHVVVRDGRTLYSEAAGFGDIQAQTPFTADSILRIYSMSKPLTSVAAMRLFEQGKFGLDDPVARFIPAFKNATVLETVDAKPRQIPPKRPITVRDVLRHTTGYSYGDESSVHDYANFCQMLVDGGQFKGRRLLKDETLRLMFTDQLEGVDGDSRFGLGFALDEVELGLGDARRIAVRYRWGGYASTEFVVVPAERFFQIFALQHVPHTDDLAKRQFAIVYAGLPPVRRTGHRQP